MSDFYYVGDKVYEILHYVGMYWIRYLYKKPDTINAYFDSLYAYRTFKGAYKKVLELIREYKE